MLKTRFVVPSFRAMWTSSLYLAPEIIRCQEASVHSDIYSIGVLLYHLLTRSYPVRARSLRDLRAVHERQDART